MPSTPYRFDRLRTVRLVTYLCVASAGALGTMYPPQVLVDGAERATALTCSALWAVSGLGCFITAWKRNLIGEFVLLRPMAFGVWAFAATLLIQVSDTGPVLLAYSLLIAALGLLLWSWWFLVDGLVHAGGGGHD